MGWEFRRTMPGKVEQLGRPPAWLTQPHLLEHEAERIFGLLHAADFLCGLSRVEFALRAARLLAEINKLHPFREGNGRTQRLFIDALARRPGYQLHFDMVGRGRMIQASFATNNAHLGMMTRMLCGQAGRAGWRSVHDAVGRQSDLRWAAGRYRSGDPHRRAHCISRLMTKPAKGVI